MQGKMTPEESMPLFLRLQSRTFAHAGCGKARNDNQSC